MQSMLCLLRSKQQVLYRRNACNPLVKVCQPTETFREVIFCLLFMDSARTWNVFMKNIFDGHEPALRYCTVHLVSVSNKANFRHSVAIVRNVQYVVVVLLSKQFNSKTPCITYALCTGIAGQDVVCSVAVSGPYASWQLCTIVGMSSQGWILLGQIALQ